MLWIFSYVWNTYCINDCRSIIWMYYNLPNHLLLNSWLFEIDCCQDSEGAYSTLVSIGHNFCHGFAFSKMKNRYRLEWNKSLSITKTKCPPTTSSASWASVASVNFLKDFANVNTNEWWWCWYSDAGFLSEVPGRATDSGAFWFLFSSGCDARREFGDLCGALWLTISDLNWYFFCVFSIFVYFFSL